MGHQAGRLICFATNETPELTDGYPSNPHLNPRVGVSPSLPLVPTVATQRISHLSGIGAKSLNEAQRSDYEPRDPCHSLFPWCPAEKERRNSQEFAALLNPLGTSLPYHILHMSTNISNLPLLFVSSRGQLSCFCLMPAPWPQVRAQISRKGHCPRVAKIAAPCVECLNMADSVQDGR